MESGFFIAGFNFPLIFKLNLYQILTFEFNRKLFP